MTTAATGARRYATGYVPDPADHRVTSFRHARAKLGAVALPSECDHRPHSPSVLDQNACGSCVGHAVAGAVATSMSLAGTPLGFVPSPRSVFQLARCIDRVSSNEPLVDNGSMPNQAIRSLNEWGVRAMQAPSPLGFNSDCDESNVNAEPKLGELETDATTVLVGQYEIDSVGHQRVVDICTALVNGFSVTCAVSAGNDSWQFWKPANGPLGAQSPIVLDHYVRFIGYRTDPATGKRIFRIRNQWGTGWGDAGDIEVTEEFTGQIGDIYALSVRKAAA